ncbi:MAG TPA: DsbA family protein [Terriglobales bacterium]|nr:DsbA family protein [Terriglobales bacterium]
MTSLLWRVLVALVLVTATAGAGLAAELTKEQVEQIVREYLLKNPDVVTDALRAADAKRREAQQQQTVQAIATHREQLERDATSPVRGNAGADVTVVEFFDYACPHCKTVAGAVKDLLRDDPKVRLVYKELPILGEGSMVAARAALAARAQGKYDAFHDALMAAPGSPSEASVMRAAAQLGLDVAKLKTDMASPEITAMIQKNYALAQALGLNGTPAFVIGDEFAPGAIPLARLKMMVAKARQKKP